jgi:hypothetical protein
MIEHCNSIIKLELKLFFLDLIFQYKTYNQTAKIVKNKIACQSCVFMVFLILRWQEVSSSKYIEFKSRLLLWELKFEAGKKCILI